MFWRYRPGGMSTSLEKRDLPERRGPAVCLCGLVWAFVQGGSDVRCGEKRSIVFVRKAFCAECREKR